MFAIFLCALLCTNASPLDDYHVIVYAYETDAGMWDAAETHNFATWVRSQDNQILEQFTISWCPAEGAVRVNSKIVEGRNKTLKQSLEDAKNHIFKSWTLRTDMTFFQEAKAHHDSLSKYKYKALDHKSRPNAFNCIHACSDIIGRLETGLAIGIDAGERIIDHYKDNGKVWTTKENWVLPAVLKYCDAKLP